MTETIRQCLINGSILNYDYCSRRDLQHTKEVHKDCVYIGSGNVYFINGARNNSEETLHFFVKDINAAYNPEIEQLKADKKELLDALKEIASLIHENKNVDRKQLFLIAGKLINKHS